ncbi:hypothetical protein DFH09DRAFT_1093402 [Mycena vulgaris]|nr:hypothetical protein DFH09DRAFT_1093402 [Mycena vulgaris]
MLLSLDPLWELKQVVAPGVPFNNEDRGRFDDAIVASDGEITHFNTRGGNLRPEYTAVCGLSLDHQGDSAWWIQLIKISYQHDLENGTDGGRRPHRVRRLRASPCEPVRGGAVQLDAGRDVIEGKAEGVGYPVVRVTERKRTGVLMPPILRRRTNRRLGVSSCYSRVRDARDGGGRNDTSERRRKSKAAEDAGGRAGEGGTSKEGRRASNTQNAGPESRTGTHTRPSCAPSLLPLPVKHGKDSRGEPRDEELRDDDEDVVDALPAGRGGHRKKEGNKARTNQNHPGLRAQPAALSPVSALALPPSTPSPPANAKPSPAAPEKRGAYTDCGVSMSTTLSCAASFPSMGRGASHARATHQRERRPLGDAPREARARCGGALASERRVRAKASKGRGGGEGRAEGRTERESERGGEKVKIERRKREEGSPSEDGKGWRREGEKGGGEEENEEGAKSRLEEGRRDAQELDDVLGKTNVNTGAGKERNTTRTGKTRKKNGNMMTGRDVAQLAPEGGALGAVDAAWHARRSLESLELRVGAEEGEEAQFSFGQQLMAPLQPQIPQVFIQCKLLGNGSFRAGTVQWFNYRAARMSARLRGRAPFQDLEFSRER